MFFIVGVSKLILDQLLESCLVFFSSLYYLQKRTNLLLLADLAVNHTIMHLLDRFLGHFRLMLQFSQLLGIDPVDVGERHHSLLPVALLEEHLLLLLTRLFGWQVKPDLLLLHPDLMEGYRSAGVLRGAESALVAIIAQDVARWAGKGGTRAARRVLLRGRLMKRLVAIDDNKLGELRHLLTILLI